MDIGSICLCMAIGALIVFASIGIGVCFRRCDKGQHDSDSDIRIYIPMRHRSRSGDKPNYEEKLIVLETIEVGCTEYERTVLRAIHKDIEELQRGEDDGR